MKGELCVSRPGVCLVCSDWCVPTGKVVRMVTVSSVRVRRPVLCWTTACACVCVCVRVCACLCVFLVSISCLLLQYCDARDSSLCVGIGLRAWWCVPEVCERLHGWLAW
jgi:hypothetical protein